MPADAPSVRLADALLDTETRKALSLPLVALITGALPLVETTIELTNRVCDSAFQRVTYRPAPPAIDGTSKISSPS